jgi:glutathione S-transferase
MTLQLFAHPFSSYCQKVLIALYENGTPFTFRMLGPDQPETGAEFAGLWPIKRFPLVVEDGRTILEATTIIEYLEVRHPGGVPLIPRDPSLAVEVRMMDRVFDNYVMTPMQKIVGDVLRPEGAKDPHGVEQAHALLEKSYAWLDGVMETRAWGAGADFTLADCAAAPSLFYADWVRPILRECGALRAYRTRLLERPSVARCVDEARSYRPLFPLGAPDRD